VFIRLPIAKHIGVGLSNKQLRRHVHTVDVISAVLMVGGLLRLLSKVCRIVAFISSLVHTHVLIVKAYVINAFLIRQITGV
jgi:hypothetical protein